MWDNYCKHETFVVPLQPCIPVIGFRTIEISTKIIAELKFFLSMINDFLSNTNSETQEQLSLLDEFLSENYEFRHNVLSNVYEVRERTSANIPNGGQSSEKPKAFRPFTREARNSLIRIIKSNGLEFPALGRNVDEYVYSEETPLYDPAKDWLLSLPAWDGQNHVGKLFGRLPGITAEQHHLLAIWLRSAVAHWLGMDMLHGNECVVTLIGAQGCGKSTFCASLLPPHLRSYYLDHINLGNKNDKEMALTNNLLVNLDELDQIKSGQHAELKQTLSKVMVNGRPIYGRAQKCRQRFASFVSTTNNPRPLNDPTGSRRYLCIRIPDGEFIDNEVTVDYDQLYAQVVCELQENQMRYWFTNEEVKRIEDLNQGFQNMISLEGILDVCFRHPEDGEFVRPLSVSEILSEMRSEFPTLKTTDTMNVRLGKMLKTQNYERKRITQGSVYYIVPKRTA